MASLSTLLREKYDRFILGLGILVLLVSLVLIVLGIVGRDSAAADPVPAGRIVADADLAPLRDALTRINEPALLTATNQVLVSEPRISCINATCRKLIRTGEAARICPFCQTEQPPDDLNILDGDQDKMTDKYELDNGLDRTLPDADYDLDGDGFTNLEEFRAKTSANDPASHPSMVVKLRMSGVQKRPLFYRLRGLSKSGSVYSFQVNLENLDETLFVKLGQTVKGYHIKSFNAQKETLTIERGGSAIDLPNGKKVEVPRSVAQIVNIIRPQYATNVVVGSKVDIDGVVITIKEIKDEQVIAIRPSVAALDGAKASGVVEFIISRETDAERSVRKAGGKLPTAPERAPERAPDAFPLENQAPPASNAPPVYNIPPAGGFDGPAAPPEGFGPPPAEVLQRIREANRLRPQ
jgi:hypothetical protein